MWLFIKFKSTPHNRIIFWYSEQSEAHNNWAPEHVDSWGKSEEAPSWLFWML